MKARKHSLRKESRARGWGGKLALIVVLCVTATIAYAQSTPAAGEPAATTATKTPRIMSR